MKNYTDKNYYKTQLNFALQYIDEHLGEKISVDQLAKVSNFSLFHFQRIFKIMMGESPYDLIKRLRLEKSIFLLQHHPELKIETIAFRCGFNSIENFSRQFKTKFEFTPSAYRNDKDLQKSRIYQEPSEQDFYLAYDESRKLPSPDFEVKIETLPATRFAFIRAIFGADGSGLLEAYHQLMDWAKANNLLDEKTKRYGMSIDNPEVTPAQKYRYDFGISVPPNVQADGVFEIGEMPATEYATLHAQGDIQMMAQAWDFLYKNWLPRSGRVPMHFPAIEEYVRGPEEIGWETFDIKCRVPLVGK